MNELELEVWWCIESTKFRRLERVRHDSASRYQRLGRLEKDMAAGKAQMCIYGFGGASGERMQQSGELEAG